MTTKVIRQSLAAISILALAALIVVYAALRTIETVSLAPSAFTLKDIGYGESVDDAALEAIADAREGDFFFTDLARIGSDFALANIMLAERTSDETRKQRFLEQAVTALENSLKRNPGNPYAWFRLAHARNLLGARGEEVINPLRLSFMTGPHEPRLVFTRLPLALTYFNQLDDTARTLLQHQIRFAWKKADRRTAFLAVSFGMEDYFMDAITLADPQGTERFQAYISFIKELQNQG